MEKIDNFSSSDNSNMRPSKEKNVFSAVVVANYGNQITVQDEKHLRYKCPPTSKIGRLVAGDRVIVHKGNGSNTSISMGKIIEKKPRESVLYRPNSQKKLSPIAANIDFIVIVIAIVPTPKSHLIDRYVAVSEICQIRPILVLNKSDMFTEESTVKASARQLMDVYKELGYETLCASAIKNCTEDLKKILRGRTSVFMGQSGVGKSSLINCLMNQNVSKVAPLSHSKDTGTHTTTATELFNLEIGGSVIDSPGIRELDLCDFSEDEIVNSFKEFSPYVGKCRFRNCKHDSEPGCAIKIAISSGLIKEIRWASFRRIMKSHVKDI